MQTLAARLRSAREEAGLSTTDLAEIAGISHSGLNHIEAGTRKHLRPETLIKLSKALSVSLEWLATGEHPSTRDLTVAKAG